MKHRVFRVVIAMAVLLCTALSSCARQPQTTKYTTHSMEYFDTVITVTGYETNREVFDAVAQDALEQIAEYHRLYSIYHRFDGMENLCTINELTDGTHRTVTVDRRIVDLLLYAKEMYELTDGMVNAAMGSVLSLWHDYRTMGTNDPANASLPPIQKIEGGRRTYGYPQGDRG